MVFSLKHVHFAHQKALSFIRLAADRYRLQIRLQTLPATG
jgi:hypothetical protein